jgi:hypothetical protein
MGQAILSRAIHLSVCFLSVGYAAVPSAEHLN